MLKEYYKNGSADKLLTEMIIDAELKILQENIFKDFFSGPDDVRRRKAVRALDGDQKEKEKQRLYYINKGLPIPGSLHKKNLRKYYVRNKIEVPKFLQGSERADTDPRGEEGNVNSLVTFFSKQLNLHPKKEKQIKSALAASGKGVGAATSFLGGLYKRITGTDFLPPAEITKTPEVAPTPSDSSDLEQSSDGGLTGYTSSIVAGLPGDAKMWYLYITDIKSFMYSHGQNDTSDLEADAESFIKNHVEKDVLNPSKSNVVVSKFPKNEKIDWKTISKFIKSENSNDKSDMSKFISGHYFVGKSGGTSKIKLIPIGRLPGVKQGDLK